MANRLKQKVIGTYTDRSATYDFLFTFHSNYGRILYRFSDIARYWPKIVNFTEPTFIYFLCVPPDGTKN